MTTRLPRTFELRVLQAGWGITADLVASADVVSTPPDEFLPVGDGVWLDLSRVTLGQLDAEQVEAGLSKVSEQIAQRHPG